MIDLVLEQLSSDQIQALLKPFWLEANQLAGRLPADLRAESQKILGDIRALIFRNEPVPQRAALATAFIDWHRNCLCGNSNVAARASCRTNYPPATPDNTTVQFGFRRGGATGDALWSLVRGWYYGYQNL